VDVQRSGATGTVGDLVVGGGATLSAPGSVTLEASRNVELGVGTGIAASQVGVISTVVNLGDARPASPGASPPVPPGTVLGSALLAQLAGSTDLLVEGRSVVNVWSPIAIGGRDGSGARTLGSLTIDTPMVQGHLLDGETARITARDLTLRNSGAPDMGSGPIAGTLDLDVGALHLGPGQVAVAGLAGVTGTAGSSDVRGSGGLALSGALDLATAQVTASGGASYAIQAAGALSLVGGTGAAASSSGALAGSLSLQGTTVTVDTTVLLPAGAFAATATDGAVALGAHANVSVAGQAISLGDATRYAPGGTIRLVASGAQGAVTVDAAAVLDVSGSATGGDAGEIDVVAGASASVAGTLRGAAATGWTGGSFSLDAASAPGLSSLNDALEAAGFDGARALRLRGPGQDLVLGASERITAHEVLLLSDAGQVVVQGTIDASGSAASADGGRITLAGGAGVEVDGTLDAHAFAGTLPADAFAPAAGHVELVATGGRVNVASSAVIDVTGRPDPTGERDALGTVVVRAPRDGADVAVDALAGTFRGVREVVVQGTASYQTGADGVVDPLVGGVLSDAKGWLAGSGAIRTRLAGTGAGGGLGALLTVGAGAAVSSGAADGHLEVDSDLSIGGALGEGWLGLVAAGDLRVNAVVSDGFATAARDAALLGTRTASVGLEAGGDVVLAPGAMVRTGSGDLSVRAGRDLALGDVRSVIYTAGVATAPAAGFTGPALGAFPTDGGDLQLRAGRDIVAPQMTQTTSAWLFRTGDTTWGANGTAGSASTATVAEQASWSVVYANFEQGVGALGGGDVRIDAGRNVVRLGVSLPSTGELTAPVGSVPQAQDLVVRGGGDLVLTAGGDVLGGLFMLGRGHADIRATGAIAPAGDGTPAALLGLMDASAEITAGTGAEVAAAFDPMRQAQIAGNRRADGTGTAFWGYTDRTSFDLTALSGDVRYLANPYASVDVTSPIDPKYGVVMSGIGELSLYRMFARAPGRFRLAAAGGSVTVGDPSAPGAELDLAPAPRGTLELLARDDVSLPVQAIRMDDVAPEYARGPLDPFVTTGSGAGEAGRVGSWNPVTDPATNNLRGFTPIHAGDPDPALIVAADGSVCAYQSGSCVRSTGNASGVEVVLPKPLEVQAGKDVVSGDWLPQNNGAADLSSIVAGRDVLDAGFQVRGDGTAVIEAGRNVEDRVALKPGVSWAGLSLDNQKVNLESPKGGIVFGEGDGSKDPSSANPALSHDAGPSVLVVAGAAGGMDLAGFAAAYLDPAGGQVPKSYLPELAAYMASLGFGTLPPAALVAAFDALPRLRREAFLIDQVYFPELKAAGIEYNDPSSQRYQSYDRGLRAIASLFPGDPRSVAGGDVVLEGKAVETWAEGNIDVVAPYGRVAVGSESYDSTAGGGIVTRRGGDVRIMADGNIDLYTSRVFTLQGGDITMWTSDGSITAGSGSKTSVTDVPLSYVMSNDGVVSVNAFGLQTGAGIGVLDALQGGAADRKKSRLDLIAPNGEVNAGDAGIRVVGDLNIAAATVVGMENIRVSSGSSSGVPTVAAPNLSVLAAADKVTAAASKEGAGPNPAAAAKAVAELPSIVTVEVVGYETDGSSDEADAKKRKSPPAP
jgi:hypothetical protein